MLDLSRKVNAEVTTFMQKHHNMLQETEDKDILETSPDKNNPSDYESLLVKLESDIRSHIKTEFQLKLYCDNLESRVEYLEKQNAELQENNEETKRKQQDEEVANLKIIDLTEVSLFLIV